ncbi:hypothetical protein RHMOL_Rhmol03G0102100 [Rhododendron molle]|uniref:Uncharacterized protein n=3 Tax=Rhododendron molle TaxID=49168 RepID=A0ACC0PDU1_RHOML|nr:hypothetical protein RHMOL_Rhmol03G0102100 [Rhododendron molle]KAI8563296.1 hypothetical protein RHMOL_Rhmol03G0102100 [Rhododendron molle]KAI8563299.1 hypothetical protein RHMOL_Rhmol03G0102100 [Rhododendron molle]
MISEIFKIIFFNGHDRCIRHAAIHLVIKQVPPLQMFADHESNLNPIDVPRAWIWNLPRRTVYFGTSVSTIFKGLTTEGIQYCFWRGSLDLKRNPQGSDLVGEHSDHVGDEDEGCSEIDEARDLEVNAKSDCKRATDVVFNHSASDTVGSETMCLAASPTLF